MTPSFGDVGYGADNLPYGIFSSPGTPPRTGVAIGDRVLDLAAASADPVHATGTLNAFMARGPREWAALRDRLTTWLADEAHRSAIEPHLLPRDEVRMHLPVAVADYVDFYSSRDHAENLGRLFRPGVPPLTPNWTHLPVGYHGRAGTVAVSGTPVVRPCGQRRATHASPDDSPDDSPAGSPDDAAPAFGPTQRLDIEAEVGFVVGVPSEPGTPVPMSAFTDHVFGVCLVNDWSARDIQAWEYVPLGPFLGKSFLTSVSPWVVPLAALEAARVAPPAREVPLLPYLDDGDQRWALDITLEVRLNGQLVSCPPFAGLYWTAAQQLAHLTVNGAALRTGDLFASGTVSGPRRDQRGSLIELTWGGSEPLRLADGSTRTFLDDGDEVVITATAPGRDGGRIAFGEVSGRVHPSTQS
jgi:fumarylacetoacetase